MMDAVVAHLWQSTVFSGLAALLTLAFRNDRAGIRYSIWLAASLKFLIPVAPLAVIAQELAAKTAVVEVVARSTPLPEFIAAHATAAVAPIPYGIGVASQPGGIGVAAILLAVWACGTAVVLGWWLVRWLRMEAVVRAASPLPHDAPVPVRCSTLLLEPGLFGIFRPVIVLPAAIVPDLTPWQRDAILVHELAHWRRRDNLTAVLHMLVEAFFWFHPLVWWIGRRLVVEREQACDEAVIRSRCDRRSYAEAILKICKGCLPQRLACVSGVAGGNLEKRVAAIMTAQIGERLHIAKKLLLTGVTCLALVAPIFVGIMGAWRADAGQRDAGLGAIVHGDYRTALARLRPLAEQGNAAAEERLGEMYDRGLGVTQDYTQAAGWYRKAALQGDPTAQQDLSAMYAQGHGVPRDPLAGALWARQGVLGILERPCDPKLMFETIPGVRTQLQAAAERGDPQAATYLGSSYEIGGNKPDHAKALIWISKSANQGNPKGEAALASLYLNGWVVPPSGTAAAAWMRKAAEQGLERAQCSLAMMYDQGIGVVRDHAEAARWYRGLIVSTDHDSLVQDWARTRLAMLYETGDGVARAEDQALWLLRTAADHGYPPAETRLGVECASGDALRRDYAAAARWLTSAAAKGVPSAQIALGTLYADGHGVMQNVTAAHKWFELAGRYSTSASERHEAAKRLGAISARMTPEEIMVAERLAERWLPADQVWRRMYAGGDM
ncbi:MAG TPA: M56 family metallopeptidase [Steroidobacteraceae bacterium]|nr:M56 family metallopeptidase [Steroidobacteraceae bacterium]